MMQSHKKFVLISSSALLPICLSIGILFNPRLGLSKSKATGYSILLRSNYNSLITGTGHQNVLTEDGNEISLSYSGVTSIDDNWLKINSNGYIYNDDPIHGINSLEISSTGSLDLYLGNDLNINDSETTISDDETYLINDNNTHYFKLINSGSEDIIINKLDISFSCSSSSSYHGETIKAYQDGTFGYGMYPQKKVYNPSLISTLDSLSNPESNGYYLYNNDYYHSCNSSWYYVSPIKWKALSSSGSDYFLLSDLVITAMAFDDSSVRYDTSNIHEYLNSDFYNNSFLNKSFIKTELVDNSNSSTRAGLSFDDYENTNDYVFLLSYKDLTNSKLGFSSSATSSTRLAYATEYALDNGVAGVNGYGRYWSRSRYNSSSTVSYVADAGALGNITYSNNKIGLRPAIKVTIS